MRDVRLKLDTLSKFPQIMSRLVLGDEELEAILGPDLVHAIINVLHVQMVLASNF